MADPRKRRAQPVARREHEIAVAERHVIGERPGDGETIRRRRLDRDAVAEAGEDRQAFEQMIAVGATADDMQREVDLGGRVERQRVGSPFQNQLLPSMPALVLGKPVFAGLRILDQRAVGAVGGLLLGAPHLGGDAIGLA